MFQILPRLTNNALVLLGIISCMVTDVHSLLIGGPTSVQLPSAVMRTVSINPRHSMRQQGVPFLSSTSQISFHPIIQKHSASRALSRSSDDNLNAAKDDKSPPDKKSPGIDLNDNPALYRVRISRRTGIEWGTDLSFAFVYVRGLEPGGAAELVGKVRVGDQICELRPVVTFDADDILSAPINLIGARFDDVMSSFAQLDKRISEVDLVFFRGTKEELIKACKGETATGEDDEEIILTVNEREKNSGTVTNRKIIKAKKGVNVRQVLIDNGINVYQSLTRWTNCKGKQLCGTCIVNVSNGAQNTNRKSIDEISTLRENPESYRLSCITFAYGDVTVETFPPVNAAQWTR